MTLQLQSLNSMNDLIKTETILGSQKVVVGNKLYDLVLENLSKIYIRYGNSYKTLDKLFGTLQTSTAAYKEFLIIEEDGLKTVGAYKEGALVYDVKSKSLYLVYAQQFLLLVENSSGQYDGFVKKTGDVMSGQLELNFTNKPPLIVRSSSLVENLNADYLDGKHANAFTQKALNEEISGEWTHNNNTNFKRKTVHEGTSVYNVYNDAAIRINKGDLITDGSMGSSQFMSGYTGYGWRLDASTNTLEIDNLIVRGILSVFELVVNKISATNGSLWITDAFKVEEVYNINFINVADGDETLEKDQYYIIYNTNVDVLNISNTNYESLSIPKGSKSTSTEVIPESASGKYRVFHHIIKPLENSLQASNLVKITDCEQAYVDGKIEYNIVMQKDNLSYKVGEEYKNSYNSYFTYTQFPVIISSEVIYIRPYIKYFSTESGENLYIVKSKEGEYPVLKPGDIIRCQKFTGTGVKQYHAVVLGLFGEYGFIIQMQNSSILNTYSQISYNEDGSEIEDVIEYVDYTLYDRDPNFDGVDEIRETIPEKEDSLVRIGSITTRARQNSVYLTSSENNSPYLDVVTEVNRPDFTVLYETPKYETKILTVKSADGSYIKKAIYTCNVSTVNEVITASEPIYASGPIYKVIGTLLPCQFNNRIDTDKVHYSTNTKVRLGNLDGIYNDLFGNNQPQGYGLYGENVYLTGEFYLNNGKSVASIGEEGVILATGLAENLAEFKKWLFNKTDASSDYLPSTTFSDLLFENRGSIISASTQEEGNLINNLINLAAGSAGIMMHSVSDTQSGLDFSEIYMQANRLQIANPIVKQFYVYNPLQGNSFQTFYKVLYYLPPEEFPFDNDYFSEHTYGKFCESAGSAELLGSYKYDEELDGPYPRFGEAWLKVLTYEDSLIVDPTKNCMAIPKQQVINSTNNKYMNYNGIIYNFAQSYYTDQYGLYTMEEMEDSLVNPIPLEFACYYKIAVEQTALFEGGKINGKFISAQTIEFNNLIGNNKEEQQLLGINELSEGETILYWPSGRIMNAKLFDKSTGSISGCVEFFLEDSDKNIYTKEWLLQGNSLVSEFINVQHNEGLESKGLIKKIDYFNINNSVISIIAASKFQNIFNPYTIGGSAVSLINNIITILEGTPKESQHSGNYDFYIGGIYLRDLLKYVSEYSNSNFNTVKCIQPIENVKFYLDSNEEILINLQYDDQFDTNTSLQELTEQIKDPEIPIRIDTSQARPTTATWGKTILNKNNYISYGYYEYSGENDSYYVDFYYNALLAPFTLTIYKRNLEKHIFELNYFYEGFLYFGTDNKNKVGYDIFDSSLTPSSILLKRV